MNHKQSRVAANQSTTVNGEKEQDAFLNKIFL
jgi:hypothetical protein